MEETYLAVSVSYALSCLVPAAMKLSGTAQMRTAAEHFGIAWSHYRLIGVLELGAAAAVLLGIPWRPAGLIGAAGMTLLMVGAVIFHRRAGDTAREYAAALVFLAASIGYVAVWVTALAVQ